MQISTTRFGDLTINPEQILRFPKPFLGLPRSKRFILLDLDAKSPFKWLQSCDEPEVALVITDPAVFFSDYEVKLSPEDVTHLQVVKDDELGLRVVLVVPADPRQITANLLAPLIINVTKRLAGQIILNDPRYSTRHYIFSTEGGASNAGINP
ncbi:MAG: flagellar assembly protein FliW [Syntrophomonadaceae bacterium]|nr:flagellar assembly protein FliW [Syntrophomonadaceae bacterium]